MSGFVIYRGPSQLDGAPIVAIAITSSGNRKTGNMVQTYILRADVAPIQAIREGADASICGNCVHRGVANGDKAVGRTCYVNVAQGPTVVYKALHRGIYGEAAGCDRLADSVLASIGEGRMVRLGTYGDPAAVPAAIWLALVSKAKGRTGYTHQWRTAPALRDLCMASADSAADAAVAQSQGWRTFRVTVGVDVAQREVLCPASEEAGRKAKCESCGLCKGAHATARSISIPAHGTGRGIVARRVASLA